MSDELVRRVEQVEADGKARYGENWPTLISAIDRAAGGNPQLGAAIHQVLSEPDPAAILAQSGREALVNMASNGDKEAEYTYGKMREAERQAWRRYKGR
jgi:hypothetical protein